MSAEMKTDAQSMQSSLKENTLKEINNMYRKKLCNIWHKKDLEFIKKRLIRCITKQEK